MTQPTSLLSQSEFFSDFLPAVLKEEEANGNFTGERLFSHNSEKYKAVVYLSAEGLGAIRIGKILGISPNTVLAVREREAPSIDIQKQQIAQRCRSAARLCLEAILDQITRDSVDKIPVKDLGILLGILADKAELLSGGPTQRIEVTHGVSHDDVEQYLMGLRRAAEKQKAVEAELVATDEPATAELTETAANRAPDEINHVQDKPSAAILDSAIPYDPGKSDMMDRTDPDKQGPENRIGQTTHRVDAMPVNIDQNESAQKGTDSTTLSDLQNNKANI